MISATLQQRTPCWPRSLTSQATAAAWEACASTRGANRASAALDRKVCESFGRSTAPAMFPRFCYRTMVSEETPMLSAWISLHCASTL